MSVLEVNTVTLPAYWASALVNGDFSGLDEVERQRCEHAITALHDDGWSVVSTADDSEPRFTWSYQMYDPEADCQGGDVLDYVAHRQVEQLGVTPVIFRKYPNSRGGEVVALLPEEPASEDGRTCTCYVHVGQHGEADPSHVINTTRPATPEEYADLKAELEAAPYNYRLRICRRLNHTFLAARRIALRAITHDVAYDNHTRVASFVKKPPAASVSCRSRAVLALRGA